MEGNDTSINLTRASRDVWRTPGTMWQLLTRLFLKQKCESWSVLIKRSYAVEPQGLIIKMPSQDNVLKGFINVSLERWGGGGRGYEGVYSR